jgi:hypothetical protein
MSCALGFGRRRVLVGGNCDTIGSNTYIYELLESGVVLR